MSLISDILLDGQNVPMPALRAYLAAREVISVLDEEYGGIGDNSADDGPAVNLAVDAVEATAQPGIVWFPGGRKYKINTPVRIANDVTFEGYGATVSFGASFAGAGLAPFVTFAGSSVVTASAATATRNVAFYGLTFDGGITHEIPATYGGSPTGYQTAAIIVGQFGSANSGDANYYPNVECDGVTVADCTFRNIAGSGVLMYQGKNLLVRDCRSKNLFADSTQSLGALVQFQGTNGVAVHGCVIDHSAAGWSWHGIVGVDWLTSPKNVTITGNVIKNLNRGDGMSFEGNTTDGIDRATICNNVCVDVFGECIGVDNCQQAIVNGNILRGGGIGILFTATETFQAIGNSLNGHNGGGIVSRDGAQRVNIIANNILEVTYQNSSFPGAGIYVEQSAGADFHHVNIVGNTLKDIDGAAVQSNVRTTMCAENFVYNFGRSASSSKDGIIVTGEKSSVMNNIVDTGAQTARYGYTPSGGNVSNLRGNKFRGTYSGGHYNFAQRNGVTTSTVISPVWLEYDAQLDRLKMSGTAAPATGTYIRGDVVENIQPSAGGNVGWINTANGSPGTWKSYGTIAA